MLFPGAKDGNRRCREVSYVLHLCYIKEKLEPCGGVRDGSVVWGLRGQSERFFLITIFKPIHFRTEMS